MKTIAEYLLSKNHKVISERYFILWPSNDIYEKLMKQYKNEMIRCVLDYWILSEAETLDVLEGFSISYIRNNLKMFTIPDNYDVKTLRNELIERKKRPFDFQQIHPNDIIYNQK